MHNPNNQDSIPSSNGSCSSKWIEPLRHKRARLKSQLPLEVDVLSVTGEPRFLDVAYYDNNCPLWLREECPLPTLREIYEASVEISPDLWPPPSLAAKIYRASESTINTWIREGAVRSAILCRKGRSRRMRRIYRPDLDIHVAELARTSPNSKWAAIAAVTPSIVKQRRAKRREARRAAVIAEHQAKHPNMTPEEFFDGAMKFLETAPAR